MSDVYQDARGMLEAARGVNSVVDRDNTRDHIIASMQVDIAESLRTIAYALARRDDDTRDDNTSHEDKPRDPDVEPLEVGDWVASRADVERYEGELAAADHGIDVVVTAVEVGQIIAIGFSEGEEYARIEWQGDERETLESRAWCRDLVKSNEPAIVETEAPDPADHVDDIDADFTGDEHPEADAAREALSKAEKKALKKTGKS